MTPITSTKHITAALLVTLSLGGTAHAQRVITYSAQPQPLYPYVAQQQPYAYSQPQYAQPPHPRVHRRHVRSVRRPYHKASVELAEEPRNRAHDKDDKFEKKLVVRDKPIVRRHVRVIDDPPVVVQREIDENGQLLKPESRAQYGGLAASTGSTGAMGSTGRVIRAEAEVTILGPDRMSIRLYRKQDGRGANAKAGPSPKSKKLKTSKAEKDKPQT